MTNQPLLIGLTGGIASGKSTVSQAFEQLGIDVIDSDVASRQVVKQGTAGLIGLIERYGEQILLTETDGPDVLDRAALRAIIFNDPAERQWVNQLLHPLIRAWVEEQTKKASSAYVIHAIPLLVESGLQSTVDKVLVVDVPAAVQIERLMQRDNSTQEQAKNILASQASRDERLSCADYVIDNSGPKSDTEQKVMDLHKQFLKLAQSQG